MPPKKLVTIIAAAIVACSAAGIVAYIAVAGLDKIISDSIRFFVIALLCVSLIRGWNPGRWIVIIFSGVTAIAQIRTGISLIPESLVAIWLVVLGSIYASCAIALLSAKAKAHFVLPRT